MRRWPRHVEGPRLGIARPPLRIRHFRYTRILGTRDVNAEQTEWPTRAVEQLIPIDVTLQSWDQHPAMSTG